MDGWERSRVVGDAGIDGRDQGTRYLFYWRWNRGIDRDMDVIWNACRLSQQRDLGMGMGPLLFLRLSLILANSTTSKSSHKIDESR